MTEPKTLAEEWWARTKRSDPGRISSTCPDCLKPIPIMIDGRVRSHPDSCGCGNYTTKEELLEAHGLRGIEGRLRGVRSRNES